MRAPTGGFPGACELQVSGAEFILEGLHLNRKLNKDRTGGGTRYRRR